MIHAAQQGSVNFMGEMKDGSHRVFNDSQKTNSFDACAQQKYIMQQKYIILRGTRCTYLTCERGTVTNEYNTPSAPQCASPRQTPIAALSAVRISSLGNYITPILMYRAATRMRRGPLWVPSKNSEPISGRSRRKSFDRYGPRHC